MSQLINTTGIPTTSFISDHIITNVRFVTKCRAGYMTVSDARDFDMPRFTSHPEVLISGFKKGVLQTVQVQLDNSEYWLNVFARTGKTVKLIDKAILADLTVGTINGMFYNTNLYDYQQYQAVGATSWASKAFVQNEVITAAEAV